MMDEQEIINDNVMVNKQHLHIHRMHLLSNELIASICMIQKDLEVMRIRVCGIRHRIELMIQDIRDDECEMLMRDDINDTE